MVAARLSLACRVGFKVLDLGSPNVLPFVGARCARRLRRSPSAKSETGAGVLFSGGERERAALALSRC